MLESRPTHYLHDAGYTVKSCDSPDLWMYLEGRFHEPNHVGSKFISLTPAMVSEILEEGERRIMDDMVAAHRATGRIARVRHTLTMDMPVGTLAVRTQRDVDTTRILDLIEGAGTADERVVRVVPTPAHAIPCTAEVTIEGGLFADGHSVGICTVYPGHDKQPRENDPVVYLATPDEIAMLVHEMAFALDSIACVSRDEAKAMIHRARQIN